MFMETNGESPHSASAKTQALSIRLADLQTSGGSPSSALPRQSENKKVHAAGALLLGKTAGDKHNRSRVLIKGWAVRQKNLANGRRQIFGFVVPGDLVSALPNSVSVAPFEIVAATAGITADAGGDEAATSLACSHAAHIEKAEVEIYNLLHRQIVRLGHLSGVERLADLLLEFRDRLLRAGIGDEKSFPMPLTQEVLADSLGMSMVHVNRSMQQLRQRNVISCVAGEVTVLDLNRLAALARGTWAM